MTNIIWANRLVTGSALAPPCIWQVLNFMLSITFVATLWFKQTQYWLADITLRHRCGGDIYSVSQKKVAPPKTFCDIFHLWWTCVTENYRGYCPNIFLCLYQFWSIYLNIRINCIIFTSKTPQILTVQFPLLWNSWFFLLKTSQIKWYLIRYNS